MAALRKVHRNIRLLRDQFFPVETKGAVRTYKFCLRFLDGIHCYISTGKDVSDAANKLERRLPIKGAEFSAIIDSVEVWNPKEKRWVPHRPWWEEEKEPYEWEKKAPEAFPETLRLKPLFDLQTSLIEHKFPHERTMVMDNVISCAGDIYREMTHAYPDFGYVGEKWERLMTWAAKPPLSWLQAGDWEEIRKQLQDPTYKFQRDLYLSNIQRLREETVKTPMDPKRSAVMTESLDMIKALIFWFESQNPYAPPSKQLDRLTNTIADYFPREFYHGVQIPPEKMRVKHNPSFNVERFAEEGYKDFRWWYNRIYPQIRSLDWVTVESLRVEGATLEEIKAAIRNGAGLGMWFYTEMEMLYRPATQPSYTGMYNILELKNRFGPELKQMISEAESQKREIGAMLCRTAAGQPHLSRACYGRRGTVTVADCHDGLSPLGSFHVHLGGTDFFSVPDLELAIKKEQLSCLGYTKGAHPYLKCIIPKRFYELPPETRASIKRSLDQARQDIERVNQLLQESPSNPEVQTLSQRAKATLLSVEQKLEVCEFSL